MSAHIGPTGGSSTLWHRVLCFVRGHVLPAEPSAVGAVDVYLCCRCNDVALLRERATGLQYSSVDQYFAERAP